MFLTYAKPPEGVEILSIKKRDFSFEDKSYDCYSLDITSFRSAILLADGLYRQMSPFSIAVPLNQIIAEIDLFDINGQIWVHYLEVPKIPSAEWLTSQQFVEKFPEYKEFLNDSWKGKELEDWQ